MPVVENDIIRLTTQSAYLGIKALQVYYMRARDIVGDVTYESMADDFSSKYAAQVNLYLHPSCVLELIKVENVSNEVDIYSKAYSLAGTAGTPGDALPPYVTYSVRQLRGSKVTRHGSKRFAGVPEGFQAAGVYTGGGGSPNQLVSFCSQAVTVDDGGGNTLFLDHVIVGRTLVTPPEGAPYYDIDLTKVNTVIGSDFRGLSTQNSRKFGRGI